jgi:hypothetical protein
VSDREDQIRQMAYHEVVASLILGDAVLFGRRVELAWPDGRAPQWPEENMRALAEAWRGDEDSRRWVTAVEADALAQQRTATMEKLALGSYFTVKRDLTGQPVKLTPIPGRVERHGDSYIVREQVKVIVYFQGGPYDGQRQEIHDRPEHIDVGGTFSKTAPPQPFRYVRTGTLLDVAEVYRYAPESQEA